MMAFQCSGQHHVATVILACRESGKTQAACRLLICLLNHAWASPKRINFNFNFNEPGVLDCA